MQVETIRWVGELGGHVELIDQTLLPVEFKYVQCRTVEDVWEAIKVLRIFGGRPAMVTGVEGLRDV